MDHYQRQCLLEKADLCLLVRNSGAENQGQYNKFRPSLGVQPSKIPSSVHGDRRSSRLSALHYLDEIRNHRYAMSDRVPSYRSLQRSKEDKVIMVIPKVRCGLPSAETTLWEPIYNQRMRIRKPIHLRYHKCPYCRTRHVSHSKIVRHVLIHSRAKAHSCATCKIHLQPHTSQVTPMLSIVNCGVMQKHI